MSEMLQPKSLGISGLLELARLVTPSDHEIVGFEDPEGNFFSLQQLKAIEWQEQHQMENQSKLNLHASLRELIGDSKEITKAKFIRQVRKVFHFGDSFIAVANDDTVWVLRGGMRPGETPPYWEQLLDAKTPPIPQPEEI